jgi:hypothetical protein
MLRNPVVLPRLSVSISVVSSMPHLRGPSHAPSPDPPTELTAERRSLYDDMREGIAKNFEGFATVRDDGALMGPWSPRLHDPRFGQPVWDLTKAALDCTRATSCHPGSRDSGHRITFPVCL